MVSVDVGRRGCDSVATVIKVVPQAMGESYKSLVNIHTFSDEHFEDQAIKIKKLYYKYKAKRVVIDGNGLGIGLIDYMIKYYHIFKNGGLWKTKKHFLAQFNQVELLR
mgnify:CR=1 FL=1